MLFQQLNSRRGLVGVRVLVACTWSWGTADTSTDNVQSETSQWLERRYQLAFDKLIEGISKRFCKIKLLT